MSGREKGKITIRKALEQRDEALYKRLETIWGAIAPEIQERQHSKEGHQQGPLHCGMVEDNLGKLIPDDQKLNFFTPLELFLFSAAACYHDIGKSIESKKKHGEIAMDEMLDKAKNYGLTDPEGLVLSYIVGAHDSDEVFNEVPENYHVANEDVRVRLLSSLLRLADILHSDNSRIPHTQIGDTKKEDEKTRFRKLIPGWGFDKNSQIELTAVPENYNDLNIIEFGVSKMQEEIECIAPVLRDEGHPYKISIKYDTRKLKRKAEEKTKPDLLEMDYYTEKEASIFRGRESESRELLDKVFRSAASNSFTTLLIGNSGVGKTSLIRAGLFPRLINMGWKCVWTRPLNPEPIKKIFDDINNACMMDSSGSNDIISCIKNLSDNCAGAGVLISIDQFEDILRSQPHEKEQIGKILRRIYSKSFRNVHVLLSYRGDYEPDIFSFLENASITRPEKYSLRGFDRSVALDVLRNIFLDNNIGIDDVLLAKILNEIDKKSEIGGIYPPFIQIIAKSLIESAKSKDGVVTEELYCNEGKVENIINSYLISQLTYFDTLSPPKAIFAEEILKHLVRDRTKEQIGKNELLRYLKLPEDELQELLDLMVKRRLIRHLDNDYYEIIHDFLATGVEEMIKDDERPLRSAISTLRTKTLNYQHIPSLLDKTELVSLYSMKESIHPSIQEKELLMYSYLAGNGPAWWWFKDDKDVLRTFIKKGLVNRSEKVRRTTLVAFEKLGTHEDIEIIKSMLKDNDWGVRRTAVIAFEKLASHDDLTLIKEMLEYDYSDARRVAVSALGKLGTHDDLPIIKKMLDDDSDDVRCAAVSALEKLGTHDDLPIIKKIIEDDDPSLSSYYDPYENSRRAAVSAFEKLASHDDLELIKEMLEYEDSYARRAAVSAFEKLVTHDELLIIEKMLDDYHSHVRSVAVSALGKIGTHDDLALIKHMLNDDDYAVRCAVASVFEKLVTYDDLPIIKKMLHDYGDVKSAAFSALEKLGTHDDIPIIEKMLRDDDSYVNLSGVSAIGKLGTHDDLPIIIQLLKYVDSGVRHAAFSAFEKLGTHDDIPIIKEMLKDEDSYARRLAVSTLEKLGTHDDLQIIKEMLKDDDSDVRCEAVSAFGKLGTHDDLPVIKEMLEDNDSDVRRTAVSAFEKLGTHADLALIKEMFENDDSDVRYAAVLVLEKLGTHDDLPIIKKMLEDNDYYVRKAAFSIFEKFSNESELNEITEKIALGKIINDEISLNCLISLDEKFYSSKKDVLLLHEKNPWE